MSQNYSLHMMWHIPSQEQRWHVTALRRPDRIPLYDGLMQQHEGWADAQITRRLSEQSQDPTGRDRNPWNKNQPLTAWTTNQICHSNHKWRPRRGKRRDRGREWHLSREIRWETGSKEDRSNNRASERGSLSLREDRYTEWGRGFDTSFKYSKCISQKLLCWDFFRPWHLHMNWKGAWRAALPYDHQTKINESPLLKIADWN